MGLAVLEANLKHKEKERNVVLQITSISMQINPDSGKQWEAVWYVVSAKLQYLWKGLPQRLLQIAHFVLRVRLFFSVVSTLGMLLSSFASSIDRFVPLSLPAFGTEFRFADKT